MFGRRCKLSRYATVGLVLVLAMGSWPGGAAPVPCEDSLRFPDLCAPHRVLVYSATYGFRHPVIPKANALIKAWGLASNEYATDITENPQDLNAENLANYDVVVFNHTSGKAPTLTDQLRADLARWAYCGGGFVGLGEAEDSNYAWPEFQELVGAVPVSHGLGEGQYNARYVVENGKHPVTAHAFMGQKSFRTADEVYWHRMDPRRLPYINVLVSMDVEDLPKDLKESAPQGGALDTSGPIARIWKRQPVVWTSKFRGGGRVFSTTFGHGDVAWDAPWFRSMVYEGIRWVAHPAAQECTASTRPMRPALGPPRARPRQVGKACPMPKTGPYLPLLSRLTEKGVKALMPNSVAPLYIFTPARRYVLDLSKSGAKSADLDLKLEWQNPADYDLGVTLPWGWDGAHALQPIEPNGEHVVLRDVPTCADLMIAAENFWSAQNLGEQFQATLTVRVSPHR